MAISSASSSLASTTTTGTSCRPARCAARQRRSPATISKLSAAPGTARTMIGWMMPRSRTDPTSSSSSVSGKTLRGLRGFGRKNSIGTRRGLRGAARSTVAVSAPTSPMSAARPRPSRDLPASSAIAVPPEPIVTLPSPLPALNERFCLSVRVFFRSFPRKRESRAACREFSVYRSGSPLARGRADQEIAISLDRNPLAWIEVCDTLLAHSCYAAHGSPGAARERRKATGFNMNDITFSGLL